MRLLINENIPDVGPLSATTELCRYVHTWKRIGRFLEFECPASLLLTRHNYSAKCEFSVEVDGRQLVASVVVEPRPKGSDPTFASVVVEPRPKGSDPTFTSVVVEPRPKGSDPTRAGCG